MGSSSSSFSPILLNSNNDSSFVYSNNENIEPFFGMGGVAISCKTNSDIVNAGTCIELMSAMNRKFKSTESGILLHESNDDNIRNGDQNSQSIRFAVLLPFDIMLWRTASFIFG